MIILRNVEIIYHYILDMVHRGVVILHQISNDEKIENILTEASHKGKFLVFKEQLRLMDVTFLGKVPILSKTLSVLFPPVEIPRLGMDQ